ncbi:amino acid ABC transporter substrate-binding protein [Paraphotobacterium marinum]|uniref:Amino acid ABC transporter substrate-binding protein n=1 Tax=Paraphotobacterium marinum TaxID=1755811 RepID=A0A220VEV9_9GAMM|nr:amino acid ABC transporter substrate-binding protein [Paraphotobacterium marinum]
MGLSSLGIRLISSLTALKCLLSLFRYFIVKLQKNIYLLLITIGLIISLNVNSETIKVGLSSHYYPFNFKKAGHIQGFEVDIWKEIGKTSHRQIKFVLSSFSNSFKLLNDKKIDTIANQVTLTPKRESNYFFSTPYTYDADQVFVKNTSHYHNIKDLKNRRIVADTISDSNLVLSRLNQEHNLNLKITPLRVDNLKNIVKLDYADAYVMERNEAVVYINHFNLPLKLLGPPIETFKKAYPFRRDEQGRQLKLIVDKALSQMRDNGKLTQISLKWLGMDITRNPMGLSNSD